MQTSTFLCVNKVIIENYTALEIRKLAFGKKNIYKVNFLCKMSLLTKYQNHNLCVEIRVGKSMALRLVQFLYLCEVINLPCMKLTYLMITSI